eukprot:m.18725 g.18725  ORF g.18725 m.18725 type:complete len:81 (-) comp7937_c0_seq1:46-288(-)
MFDTNSRMDGVLCMNMACTGDRPQLSGMELGICSTTWTRSRNAACVCVCEIGCALIPCCDNTFEQLQLSVCIIFSSQIDL